VPHAHVERATYALRTTTARLPRREDTVLVLTRRANQSIMIGHEIVVTVLEVRGDQVRIGIKAPRSIDVHREEIFLQLQQANREAATPTNNEVLETLSDLAPADDAETADRPRRS
jgi:carbon storage regulator